jgi:protein-S-isoprenylcysteine O-methyltransferase Ste14
MRTLQSDPASACGRLLRVLLVRLGKVPADASAARVLLLNQFSRKRCAIRGAPKHVGAQPIESGVGGSMGNRGLLWVIVQAVLLALFLVVPRIGPAWPIPNLFYFAGGVLAVSGIAFMAWSALNLGRSLTPFPRPLPEGRLVTTGAYRFVRHPIYFGLLLACFGFAMATLSPLRLMLIPGLFVFFNLKARREESWLQEQYPAYASYKVRVKKLIPWIY